MNVIFTFIRVVFLIDNNKEEMDKVYYYSIILGEQYIINFGSKLYNEFISLYQQKKIWHITIHPKMHPHLSHDKYHP